MATADETHSQPQAGTAPRWQPLRQGEAAPEGVSIKEIPGLGTYYLEIPPPPTRSEIDDVTDLRAKLYSAGFPPIPVYNWNDKGPSPGKRPLGDGWQNEARKSPPLCASSRAVPYALNTGILCDGLRAADIDVKDVVKAHECRDLALTILGVAPIRHRANSARCLLVYRAADGEPTHRQAVGKFGKIQILGRGQQFAALGKHDTGADLQWHPAPLGTEGRDDLVPLHTGFDRLRQRFSTYASARR